MIAGFILGAVFAAIMVTVMFLADRQLAVVCIEYDAKEEKCLKTIDRDDVTVDKLKEMYQK